MDEQKAAKRDNWKTLPLAKERAKLAYERTFSGEERERLALGLIPHEMEDKWFIFLENDILYFHRSWTGICIFEVHLEPIRNGSKVAEAWVCRDPSQYKSTDENYDVSLLRFLVERILLGLDAPFPIAGPSDSAQAALQQFHVVGHSRSNKE